MKKVAVVASVVVLFAGIGSRCHVASLPLPERADGGDGAGGQSQNDSS